MASGSARKSLLYGLAESRLIWGGTVVLTHASGSPCRVSVLVGLGFLLDTRGVGTAPRFHS